MMEAKDINVLIACEESQEVCKAFRSLGFNAFSNDVQECSGGHPEWHLQIDSTLALKSKNWHLVIAHPPCTYMANSGVQWLFRDSRTETAEQRQQNLQKAKEFFKKFLDQSGPIAIENPIPHKYAELPRYSQTIQPYEYGHTTTKRTCLWLKGLPNLVPTHIIPKEQRTQDIWLCPPGPNRQKIRSKTFDGIAKAMAEQWGSHILKELNK